MDRYRFTKGGLFASLEVRDRTLVVLMGRREEEATIAPMTERFQTAEEAVDERDRLMRQLIGRGYERDAFGGTDAARRARSGPPALADAAALESVVADETDDEVAWSVLEDWLLQQEDPRGQLVQLAREGQAETEAHLRAEYLPLLYGRRHPLYERAVRKAVWRGGYLIECTLEVEPPELVEGFLGIPAGRLVRKLTLIHNSERATTRALTRLLRVDPRSIRELNLATHWNGGAESVIDARSVATLPLIGLGSLTTKILLRNVASLPSLRTLAADEPRLDGLEELMTGTLPALERFSLSLRALDRNTPPDDVCRALEPLAQFAPNLRTLSIATSDRIFAAVAAELGRLELVRLNDYDPWAVVDRSS